MMQFWNERPDQLAEFIETEPVQYDLYLDSTQAHPMELRNAT